jgi:hypothetical protein
MMPPKIYHSPIERPSRLAELGLREEQLLEAVRRGQSARANCTLNHPLLYHGISAWAETINALRQVLLPDGWKRSENGNLPLTVNKTGNLAITVSTGDEATGRLDGNLSTKSSKGPRTADAVTVNAAQTTLFGDIRLRPEDLKDKGGMMTWILLFHRDNETHEVRSELSRPTNMNAEGYVDEWAERIILCSTPIGGDGIKVPTDVPQTPNVVVEVKRRRA